MNPYQYLNTNNNQTTDLSYNATAKALIDSLLSGANVTQTAGNKPLMVRDPDSGILTNEQAKDENGNLLYTDSTYESPTTDLAYRYSLNGYDVTPQGNNTYQVGIDDPTTKGMFTLNAQIDPLTNKLSNLGTTYGSNKPFDYKTPAMFAALVGGGLLAAPYLGGASLFGEGALAGGGLAGGEAIGGAVGGGSGSIGGAVGADVASSAVGADGFYGLGTGTSYAPGATTNPLSAFYGTAQASPTSLGLVSGGGGATIGEGSIIGSGMGLGQTVPASVLNVANSLNMPKIPSQGSTPQKQMANALRLPTDLNTNVAVYKQENPFYYSPQQQLANMLKV